MFGFMVTTCFLSMWLSNTATAAMLMPIAHAVLEEMNKNRKESRCDDEAGIICSNNSSPNLSPMIDEEGQWNMCCMCYIYPFSSYEKVSYVMYFLGKFLEELHKLYFQ